MKLKLKKNISLSLVLFLGCLATFALLLYKDPFSQRTLIPNFEPFPDALYYIGGAKGLIEGYGLNLVREGRALNFPVPPLYSLTLVPIMFIFKDPRSFYYTNILFSLVSAVLFYKITSKLIQNIWIVYLVFFLYITNYFFYWYPTVAMAENLILPLFLLGVYLLINRVIFLNIVAASFLVTGFYATKYASIPLSLSFALLYAIKLMFWDCIKTKKVYVTAVFLGLLSLVYIIFAFYESSRGNSNIVASIFNTLSAFFKDLFPKTSSSAASASVTESSGIFSYTYFKTHLPMYWNWLNGGSIHFLWDTTPILPKFIGSMGLIGLSLGLFVKHFKFVSFSLLLMLFSSVFFIATFYTVDARYVYHAIPALLVGFAFFLNFLFKILSKKNLKKIFYVLLVLFFAQYMFTNSIRIKKQIMLNLKYAETPWYYVSILETNNYFSTDKIQNGKKPVLVSAMPPYLFDYFSNQNYTLLPLSKDQEFWKRWEIVWGPNDYSDLIILYSKYLSDGFSVYLSNSGLGNEGYLHADYRRIKEGFELVKVANGCFDTCNIYKIELKDE